MAQAQQPNLWDAVRSWAGAAGMLLPPTEAGPVPREVPRDVCDSCPVCQAAATADQVNAQAVAELAEMARGFVAGLVSAMGQASQQRTSQRDPAAAPTPSRAGDVARDGAGSADQPAHEGSG